MCEEHEGCGAGRSTLDDGCLMEGWCDDDSDDEERAAGRRRNEETTRETLEEERIGGGSSGGSDGDEDEGEDRRFKIFTEEDLMRGLEEGWEELVRGGGRDVGAVAGEEGRTVLLRAQCGGLPGARA